MKDLAPYSHQTLLTWRYTEIGADTELGITMKQLQKCNYLGSVVTDKKL